MFTAVGNQGSNRRREVNNRFFGLEAEKHQKTAGQVGGTVFVSNNETRRELE